MDVAPEGEGDGLPVALPIRIEAGVARLGRRPTLVVGPAAVALSGRRRGPAATAEHESEDEGQHHEEARAPEAAVALDPRGGEPGASGGGGAGVSASGTGRVSRSVGDVRTL